jgi:hypothetical protein
MITEPTTLATDYVLGTLCAVLAWRLQAAARRTGQRAVALWALAFATTGFGSFAGGTYHGFSTVLPARVADAIWTVTTISVGLAACLLLSAALTASVPSRQRRWLLVGVWAQFVVYAAWMLWHDAFVNVIAEYGAAMLLILLLQMATAGLRRAPSAPWIAAGVAVTIAAAAVQQSGFDLYRNLNHNDLQHLVQMAAVFLLYKGGAKLRDLPLC